MSLISHISSIAIQATNWKIAIEDINSISEGREKHNLQQPTKEKLSQGRAPGGASFICQGGISKDGMIVIPALVRGWVFLRFVLFHGCENHLCPAL
jgi:hypothetical protein